MITSEMLKKRLEHPDPGFILVDVRTPEEYAQGHILGALLIPNETIGDSHPAALPDLDEEIVLYCRSGVRSNQALKKLSAMGYTHLNDLDGGILNWPYRLVR